jgi:hypothetical protein
MNVRFDGHYFGCECGSTMMYLESPWNTPQRRITCTNDACAHHGEVYLEPVWRVELAPAAAPVT